MKQAASMLWKEWHELRVYLFIAMGIFLGLPFIDGLEELQHRFHPRFEFSASPWVLALGGVLAIFVAVGASCRDFNGRLEDFWRSRPVGPVRWMLVKYAVGLFVVLVSCMMPLAVELAVDRGNPFRVDVGTLLAWFPFLWAALYSMAFLFGCLTQRTAQAAMLALGAMLLVYCLPLILPPLAWLNVADIMRPGSDARWFDEMRFGLGMLGLAIAGLALALLAVRRGWRIESGRKMMYGSVSAAILILFGSAAYEVGTNLPILQEINLPAGEYVRLIHCDGSSGFVITTRWVPRGDPDAAVPEHLAHEDPNYQVVSYRVRKFQMTASGIELGPAVTTRVDPYDFYFGASTPERPEILYYVYYTSMTSPHLQGMLLTAANLYTSEQKRLPGPWATDGDDDVMFPYALHDRLYLIRRRHIITYDITQPLAPRLISDTSSDYYPKPLTPGTGTLFSILPPLPGLSPRERLDAALKIWARFRMDGDILCLPDSDRLTAYKLDKITDRLATFKKIGEFEPSLLESSFLGRGNINNLTSEHGLLYFTGSSSFPNPSGHVTVLDVNSRPPLRTLGHFGAPQVTEICPLPDGRAIVGGDKLWLVGPPPRHGP